MCLYMPTNTNAYVCEGCKMRSSRRTLAPKLHEHMSVGNGNLKPLKEAFHALSDFQMRVVVVSNGCVVGHCDNSNNVL